MAPTQRLCNSLIILMFSATASSQFYDFFQPFVQTYTTTARTITHKHHTTFIYPSNSDGKSKNRQTDDSRPQSRNGESRRTIDSSIEYSDRFKIPSSTSDFRNDGSLRNEEDANSFWNLNGGNRRSDNNIYSDNELTTKSPFGFSNPFITNEDGGRYSNNQDSTFPSFNRRPTSNNRQNFANERPKFGNSGSGFGNSASGFGNSRPSFDTGRRNTNRPVFNSETTFGNSGSGFGNNRPSFGNDNSDFGNSGTQFGNSGSSFSSGNNRPSFGNNKPSNERPIFGNDETNYGNNQASSNSRPNNRPIFGSDTDYGNNRPNSGNNRPNPGNSDNPFYTDDNRPTRRPSPANNRPTFASFNTNSGFTTQNPFSNNGVRPAVVHGQPITNRPGYAGQQDAITFPDDLADPELTVGPSYENLSLNQKRRLYDAAAKLCEKYQSKDISQVAAIPLLPSPDPVRVNISKCAHSTPLIVGGQAVSIEEFPHNALVGWEYNDGGYAWKCGGSLIHEKFVLTAAHCAYTEKDRDIKHGPPKAVQLGSSQFNAPGALVYRVRRAIRHPGYLPSKSYYDIALLRLNKAVTFSKVIQPACLGSPPSVGDNIIATGWGHTKFGGEHSQELLGVSIPVWDITECAEVLGTSHKLPDGVLEDNQFCAGDPKGGKDTCNGDSGGPVQVRAGCSWRVLGVTSVGRACGAPRTPAIYAALNIPFVMRTIQMYS